MTVAVFCFWKRELEMHPLCKVSELGEDAPLECEGPGGEAVVVVRSDGRFFAAEGVCPHQGAPLADGEAGVDENGEPTLTCCLHFWSWRLADGAPLEDAEESLRVFPVREEGGTLYMVSDG